MFASASDLGLDAHLFKAGAQQGDHLRHIGVPLRRSSRHHLLDLGIALRVKGGEGKILKLPLNLLHPKPVSKRRIDIQGLLRGPTLLVLWHHRQCPHVVETVRKLDHQHPPIRRHGDEHLADGGCLLGLFRVEGQPVKLGDPFDHCSNLCTEQL